MTLRSYLVVLTLATLLPVAIFAAVMGVFFVESERETFRRGAEERTRAVLTAIDTELNSSIGAAHALAAAPSLLEPKLHNFRQVAANILGAQPNWINITLARPDGQQIMNMRVPDGEPLPNIGAVDGSFERVLRTGAPVVSDLYVAPVLKQWNFVVRVPTIRDGKIKYVLSAAVNSDAIGRLIRAQHLPPDWVGVVLDRNNRIVARSVNPEESVGQLASQSLRDALARSPSGWFHGTTIEGTVVYTPYRRSETTGWVFAMGIPASAVEQVATRATWILALGLLAAVGLAVALATIVGRRIAGPIGSLAAATQAMGRGDPVTLPHEIRISEVHTLAAALHEAAQAIHERHDLVEREKEALRAADRSKDEFLAVLSHELRTPLAALTTAAHILRVADPGHDAARQARGIIDRQTKQMSRLVEDLLDISRVTMGKASLQREALDLAGVAVSVIAAWRVAGRFDHHEIAFRDTSVWVDADRARMEQIVSNLLDNALKFTPAGRKIEVGLREENGEAVLQVSDEGEGIAPDAIGRVFDLFAQGEHGPDRSKGGLGIGLALVKRLTEMHGGTVAAVSEGPGKGAVFTVRLPAVARPHQQPAPAATEPHAGPRRVLIIEDNDDARQMLRAALALDGHEVREAPDGATGLAAAAEARPDVVLIDIGLPDIDGYEVARRLRADQPNGHIALIALSGYGQPGDRQRALDAGFDVHLTKPVATELLKSTLAAFR
ncbi:MAG: response regulator [Betaproteobacteria bacterium]|nr:response regulator [Betaproteobacteria bacterium]